MMVLGPGTDWDTLAMASHHRDEGTLVSLRLDHCFHRGSLTKPGMGQKWSDMAAPEVHKSPGNATTPDLYKGC